MVIAVQKVIQIHRNNAKGRRECFVKKENIPGPIRGKFCVVPRPKKLLKKLRKKKE